MAGRMGPKGRARIGLRDWAKKVLSRPARRPTRGARFMRMGASMASAMARVHTFKRVGEPVVLQTLAAPTYVGIQGNTDLLSTTVSGLADQFVTRSCQVRGAFRFNLSQASNISEITNLFDNYRIVRVKLMFNLSGNSGEISGANGFPIPLINYAYDPDDNTAPAARTNVLENGYCQTRRLDKPFSITLTPRAQQSVTGGVGGAGGLLPTSTWLDCNSPAIQHYGLKFWIDQFPFDSTAQYTYALTITPVYYLEAKNVV